MTKPRLKSPSQWSVGNSKITIANISHLVRIVTLRALHWVSCSSVRRFCGSGSEPEASKEESERKLCAGEECRGGTVHVFLYIMPWCLTCLQPTCIMFVKTNEWTIFKVSQKVPVISAEQQAGLTLALLLCTRGLQSTSKSCLPLVGWGQCSPWWVARITGTSGGITLWVSMRDCRASVSSGSAPRKRSVCSASESHSNSMWTVSRNSSAWNNQAQKMEPLSAVKVLAIGVCQGKGLGLNSSVHHRSLMALSKSHKGYISFVDLWQRTEFIISLIQINTKIL